MTFEEIKRLLEMVREHELSEFELEREDFKIRIRRRAGAPVVTLATAVAPSVPLVAASGSSPQSPSLPVAPPPVAPSDEDDGEIELAVVKSPIVGTFYRSSEPGAAAFAEIGDTVRKNQVLCII